jgi:hypothetical protein
MRMPWHKSKSIQLDLMDQEPESNACGRVADAESRPELLHSADEEISSLASTNKRWRSQGDTVGDPSYCMKTRAIRAPSFPKPILMSSSKTSRAWRLGATAVKAAAPSLGLWPPSRSR